MNSLIQWSKKTIKVLLLFVVRTLMFSPFFFAANSGKQFLTTLCPNEKGNLFNDRLMDGWMDVEKSFTNLLTKRKGKERKGTKKKNFLVWKFFTFSFFHHHHYHLHHNHVSRHFIYYGDFSKIFNFS